MSKHKFWFEDPKVLFSSVTFLPDQDMDPVELLNVMTRLIIVLALLLFLISFKEWWVFLIAGILLIGAIWYFNIHCPKEVKPTRVEHFQCPRKTQQVQKTPVKWKMLPRY